MTTQEERTASDILWDFVMAFWPLRDTPLDLDHDGARIMKWLLAEAHALAVFEVNGNPSEIQVFGYVIRLNGASGARHLSVTLPLYAHELAVPLQFAPVSQAALDAINEEAQLAEAT